LIPLKLFCKTTEDVVKLIDKLFTVELPQKNGGFTTKIFIGAE
jgi:hypothetical protein